MHRMKFSPGMVWAVLRAMELMDKEPGFLQLSEEDAAEIKATLADINPKPRTGWVTMRNMSTRRVLLTIKLFEHLSRKSRSLFTDEQLGKKLYIYSEAVRRRFYELYLRKYLVNEP